MPVAAKTAAVFGSSSVAMTRLGSSKPRLFESPGLRNGCRPTSGITVLKRPVNRDNPARDKPTRNNEKSTHTRVR
jgi:hypothetical protein